MTYIASAIQITSIKNCMIYAIDIKTSIYRTQICDLTWLYYYL